MRSLLLTVFFGLLFAAPPACSAQSLSQAVSGDEKRSSPKRLVLEVLQTDLGVGGTNQFVYVRVFSDGLVEYHPKRVQDLRKQRASQGQISKVDLDEIAGVLARKDVAVLPPRFKSTYTPTDFYWTLDFAIPRGSRSQRIKVVNFYPAMAVQNNKTYPDALVRLVCAAWAVRKHFPTEMPDLSGDCGRFAGQN